MGVLDIARLAYLADRLVGGPALVVDLSQAELEPQAVTPAFFVFEFRRPVIFVTARPTPDGVVRANDPREAARYVQGRDLSGVRGDAPPKLNDVPLDSAVTVEVELVVTDRARRRLFLKLVGDYPHGSAGRQTGAFISAVLDVEVVWEQPDSVIVDLSSFSYEWGDDLFVHPLGFGLEESRVRFVATESLAASTGIRPHQIAPSRAEAEDALDALDDFAPRPVDP